LRNGESHCGNYCKGDLRFNWVLRQGSLLPFTVTKTVTSREISIAVESRDAKLVIGKFFGKAG